MLETLSTACHYLESDKAAERKRHLDILKNVLQTSETSSALDKNSKSKKGITYTVVFQAVHGCFMKESDILSHKWSTLGTDQKFTKKRHVQDIANVARTVIKLSCKTSQHDTCSSRAKVDFCEVSNCILSVLKRHFQNMIAGSIYLSMFTEELLKQHRFSSCISSAQYKELLSVCCETFKSQEKYIDDKQLVIAASSILCCVTQLCEPRDFYWFSKFICKAVGSIQKTTSSVIVQYIYGMLSNFSHWQFSSHPHAVHELGKVLLPNVAQVLSSKSCGTVEYNHAIDFCELQIRLYKKYVLSSCDRMWTTNHILWLDLLKGILFALENSIRTSCAEFSTSKGTSDRCNEYQIKLVSDIIQILFSIRAQLSELDVVDADSEESSIDTGFVSSKLNFSDWMQIVEFIPPIEVRNQKEVCIWLKVIKVLLQGNFLTGFSANHVIGFASRLHELLSSCKAKNVLKDTVGCLIHLLNVHFSIACTHEAGGGIWADIWNSLRKLVPLALIPDANMFSDAVFTLLSLLLKQNHQANFIGHSLMHSFVNEVLPPLLCSASLRGSVLHLLHTFIQLHGFPDLLLPDYVNIFQTDENLINGNDQLRVEKSLQCKLLLWLLKCKESEFFFKFQLTDPADQRRRTSLSNTLNSSVNEANSIVLHIPSFDLRSCFSCSMPTLSMTASTSLSDILVACCWDSFVENILETDDGFLSVLKRAEKANHSFLKHDNDIESVISRGELSLFDHVSRTGVNTACINEVSILATYHKPVCQLFMKLLDLFVTNVCTNLTMPCLRSTEYYNDALVIALFTFQLLVKIYLKWKAEDVEFLLERTNQISASIGDAVLRMLDIEMSNDNYHKKVCACFDYLYNILELIFNAKNSPAQQKLLCKLRPSFVKFYQLASLFLNKLLQCKTSDVDRFSSLSEEPDHLINSSFSGYEPIPNDSIIRSSSHHIVQHVHLESFSKVVELIVLLWKFQSGGNNIDVDLNCLQEILSQFDMKKSMDIAFFFSIVNALNKLKCHLTPSLICNVIGTVKDVLKYHYVDSIVFVQSLDCIFDLISIHCGLLKLHPDKYSLESIVSLLEICERQILKQNCTPAARVSLANCFYVLSECYSLPDNVAVADSPLSCKTGVFMKLLEFVDDENFAVASHVASLVQLHFSQQESLDNPDGSYLSFCKKSFGKILKAENLRISCHGNDGVGIYYKLFCHLWVLCSLAPYSGHFLEARIIMKVCEYASKFCFSKNTSGNVNLDAVHVFKSAWNKSQLHSRAAGDLILKNVVSRLFRFLASHWPTDLVDDFPYPLLGCPSHVKYMQQFAHEILPLVKSNVSTKSLEKFEHCKEISSEHFIQMVSVILVNAVRDSFQNVPVQSIQRQLAAYLSQLGGQRNILSMSTFPHALVYLLTCYHPTNKDDSVKQHGNFYLKFMSQIDPLPMSLFSFNCSEFPELVHVLLTLCNCVKISTCADAMINLVNLIDDSVGGFQTILLLLYKRLLMPHNLHESKRLLMALRLLVDQILPKLHNSHTSSISLIVTITFLLSHQLIAFYDKLSQCFKPRVINQCLICCTICINGLDSLFSFAVQNHSQAVKVLKTLPVVMTITSSLTSIALAMSTLCERLNADICQDSAHVLNEMLKKLVLFLTTHMNVKDQYRYVFMYVPHFAQMISVDGDHASILVDNNSSALRSNLTKSINFISCICRLYVKNAGFDLLLEGATNHVSNVMHKLAKLKCQFADNIKSVLKVMMRITRIYDHTPVHVAKCLESLLLESSANCLVFSLQEWNEYGDKEMVPRLLTEICQLCFHRDSHIVEVANECLSKLCQYSVVKDAIDDMPLDDYLAEKSLLKVFQSSDSMPVKPVKNLNDASIVQNLWSCLHNDHKMWLSNLTCHLIEVLDDEFLHATIPVCRKSKEVCDVIIVHLFAQLLSGPMRAKILKCIVHFLSSAFEVEKDLQQANKLSLLSILQVVEIIRQESMRSHEKVSSFQEVEQNALDGFDYLIAARVASMCGESLLSLLYVEIWRGKFMESSALHFNDYMHGTKSVEQLIRTENVAVSGLPVTKLVLSAFRCISDDDGQYGMCSVYNQLDAVMLYEQDNMWDKALKSHDLHHASNFSPDGSTANIINALQKCGLENVHDIYVKGIQLSSGHYENNKELEELKYKAAWEAGHWDAHIVSKQSSMDNAGYHQLLYASFKALRSDNVQAFEHNIKKARQTSIGNLSICSLNHITANNISSVLVQLLALKETESTCTVIEKNVSEEYLSADIMQLLENKQTLHLFSDFDHFSLISRSRSATYKVLLQRYSGSQLHKHINEQYCHHMLSCLEVCEKHMRLQHAHKILRHLNKYVTFGVDNDDERQHLGFRSKTWWKFRCQLETAKLLWKEKEERFAISVIRDIRSKLKRNLNGTKKYAEQLLLVECYRILGIWLEESRLEGPAVIMNDCFKPAAVLAEKVHSSVTEHSPQIKHRAMQERVSSYYCLAKFADGQYQEVQRYKRSHEYTMKKTLASASMEELQTRKRAGEHCTPKTKLIVEKNVNIDKSELTRLDGKATSFLLSAIENYILCLRYSSKHDLLIYRLCTLWFNSSADDAINGKVKSGCDSIASFKFLPLAYQLSARLNSEEGSGPFQKLLSKILVDVSSDHIHHVLPILLSLVNSSKDAAYADGPQRKRAKYGKSTPKKDDHLSSSAIAAKSIINQLRTKHPDPVSHLEQMSLLLIEFANFDASQWKAQTSQKISIPKSVSLYHLCDQRSKMCQMLQDVPVPIIDLPVNKDINLQSTLSGVVTFTAFKPYFQLCGGVNLPKVLVCLGSDGVERKLLLKGKDDLHQDAVMQQVFGMVNTLLQRNSQTQQLSMRKYKVIPLSQRSGIVEWCNGTMSLGSYLIGASPVLIENGAHQRYHPSDWSVKKCRQELTRVNQQPAAIKLQKYLTICENLHPVFRHFFTEKFLDPTEWFVRRRAYVQSVAVSSIVGYMVGLGDRHMQNILIDCKTGELVHIDLGVAFEQGLCLPTPETVPFRLTRDLVDGMGILGVEGVFRRCCEKTVLMLRSSYDVVLTIVEVLLYDPLYEWTITPAKATTVQRNSILNCMENSSMLSTYGDGDKIRSQLEGQQTNTNKLAERALLRIQDKLKGFEEGSLLSVTGHVNMLIQQATDPQRLSQLYSGWQPYL